VKETSPPEKKFVTVRAEEMRLRYLYRKLAIQGELQAPRETLKKLVGPDCAYHLYGRVE
jgi:hypothetical protein